MHVLALAALLFACGGAEAPAPEPEPAPAAPEPATKTPDQGGEARAKVFFSEPADGAKVKSPVKLVFGVEGMAVKPAGTLEENTGHHHLIIGPAGVEKGVQVPKDETHIHYGKGQTSAEVELDPGEHKLTMQFADGNHLSYGEVMAATITITVEK